MSLNAKTTVIFISSAIVWMVAFGISNRWAADARVSFRIVYTLISLLLTLYMIGVVAQKHFRQINRILLEECDPEKYMSAMRDTLGTARNNRKPSFLLVMMAYSGLYESGRYEDALARLQSIKIAKRKSARQRAVCYSELSEVYIALGRLNEAEDALNQCFAVIDHGLTNPRVRQQLKESYARSAAILSMARGCYDGAESIFETAFAEAKCEYSRVHARYWLGLIYRYLGEDDKAKEAFAYVAEHGNRLHFAEVAREHLGLDPQPSVASLWQAKADDDML